MTAWVKPGPYLAAAYVEVTTTDNSKRLVALARVSDWRAGSSDLPERLDLLILATAGELFMINEVETFWRPRRERSFNRWRPMRPRLAHLGSLRVAPSTTPRSGRVPSIIESESEPRIPVGNAV